MSVGRSYCTDCDDYGHVAEDHKANISWSEFRRLRVMKGAEDWWVNHGESSADGPVCLFCDKIIDWAPGDHEVACPVRRFFGFEEE